MGPWDQACPHPAGLLDTSLSHRAPLTSPWDPHMHWAQPQVRRSPRVPQTHAAAPGRCSAHIPLLDHYVGKTLRSTLHCGCTFRARVKSVSEKDLQPFHSGRNRVQRFWPRPQKGWGHTLSYSGREPKDHRDR